ncbi:hypothetical protein [Streptomyces capillispiralis]|uniref:Uncharacterized protein n=1 Tax=Streptomyces capillispiralis TaxID=68182 RepID=A0A561T8M6_9ACTN|nr:hypothetical protein [Streptomyces capillispiralis]TWF83472.1 hypothetical protein FHX78_11397 [Streptomyces capillispiralis]GHH91740.1 hypothetical protein GCM10017779_21970 [Streptomyces capillispiralis]
MRRRTLLTGALLGTLAAPALATGTARAAAPGPSVTRTGRTTLDSRAIAHRYDTLTPARGRLPSACPTVTAPGAAVPVM